MPFSDDDDDDDDGDESIKLVFVHTDSLETVTSLLMKICSGKQVSFDYNWPAIVTDCKSTRKKL